MRLEIVKKSFIFALWATLQSTFVLTHDTSNFTELMLEQPDNFVDKSLLIKAILEDKSPVISILRPSLWGKTLNLDMVRTFLQIEVDPEGIVLPRNSQTNRKYFTGFEIRSPTDDWAENREVTSINIPMKIGALSNLGQHTTAFVLPMEMDTPPPFTVKNVSALKISNFSEAMEHQGIYPVIWLDFEYSVHNTYSEMEGYLKYTITKIFDQFPYLQDYTQDEGEKSRLSGYLSSNFTSEEFSDSLRFLSELLYKHFNRKIYVLVNDYNAPFNLRAMFPKGESIPYEKVVNLLKNLFCSTFNNNPYIKKGIFTATIPSSEAYSSVFSHLNNFTEYTLLDDEFSEFYGFTQSEVDDLLERTPPKFVMAIPVEVKNLYKGYNHGKEIVYNPTSVIRHIELGGRRISWLYSDTLPHQSIDSQLSKDERLQTVRDLVSGYGIVSAIKTGISYQNSDDVTLYSALLFAGYLNPIPLQKSNLTYRLTIPNDEVKEFYMKKIISRVKDKLPIDVFIASNFVNMLPICLVDGFKSGYQKLISGQTDKLQKLTRIEQEFIHQDLLIVLLDTLSPSYKINYQKFPSTNETVATMVPKVFHMHTAIFIGYKVIEDYQNLTSVANSTLQNVNCLKFDPKSVTCTDIQNIVRIGIAICKWHTALVHNVETVS